LKSPDWQILLNNQTFTSASFLSIRLLRGQSEISHERTLQGIRENFRVGYAIEQPADVEID